MRGAGRSDGAESLGDRVGRTDPGNPWAVAGATCANGRCPGGAAVGRRLRTPSTGVQQREGRLSWGHWESQRRLPDRGAQGRW